VIIFAAYECCDKFAISCFGTFPKRVMLIGGLNFVEVFYFEVFLKNLNFKIWYCFDLCFTDVCFTALRISICVEICGFHMNYVGDMMNQGH